MAPRKPHRRILPFRIPFFRIFYSTTYTTLYIIELCLLAITPISIIWTAVQNKAYQYVVMVGGVYVLTASLAIFIYSSRLYTNRSVLAGVGKAYIPIEDGELGRNVRKMIVKQLERSCIVAWESRPRDLEGEILEAEKRGMLSSEEDSIVHNYTVGRIIPVDPENPPWGRIEHEGWSSPSHRDDNRNPHVQFADVVAELPNLIEARAVSLAPPDPTMTPTRDGQPVIADPTVVELLRRPENMGMREYLTQLGYLGLIQPPTIAQTFLPQYERARFCGRPISEAEFSDLMKTFSLLLSGMSHLEPEIIDQIRAQTAGEDNDLASSNETSSLAPPQTARSFQYHTPSPVPPRSPGSSLLSPVTAREAMSRNTTPRLTELNTGSQESFSSVVHNTLGEGGYGVYEGAGSDDARYTDLASASQVSLASDAGSVLRHSPRLNGEGG